MKDRLVPTIDAIVRVCDGIVRTIEERREEAAGLFFPQKSRRLSRLCLGFAFSDIRQQLEDAVGCQSSPLSRIAHRIASAVVRFLLPEIRQILKSYGEAQARDAAERRKTSELILWYASGNDPRFKPRDGRQANAIKDHMVREGLSMMAKDGSLSERSAANSLVRKYHDIPGAYTDAETLRKQINRTKNRTSDSDMS